MVGSYIGQIRSLFAFTVLWGGPAATGGEKGRESPVWVFFCFCVRPPATISEGLEHSSCRGGKSHWGKQAGRGPTHVQGHCAAGQEMSVPHWPAVVSTELCGYCPLCYLTGCTCTTNADTLCWVVALRPDKQP